MKKFITAGISAVISLSVFGASLSTPAHAGERQSRIAAGLAIGAVTGIIIAGEFNRRANKKRARKAHQRAYRKKRRQIRKQRRQVRKQRQQVRQHRRYQRRWQRDRYDNDYDRYDRYERYGYEYNPDRQFDDYADDVRPKPRVKSKANKSTSKRTTKRSTKRKPKKTASNNSRSHVQRCIQAYRTYDPQSDTYIGNDGRERVCRK